ncbi:MAG TPA: PAC2 family protein [Actinomycetota bacterium]|jgi:proteasome assembly chaperone (PAC2) family protein
MPEPSSSIRYERDVELHQPVMLVAFRGWNDAGDAASFAAQHLGRSWDALRIASIDPEEFYDFQAVRPQVELVDGLTRKITWPENEFLAAASRDEPDVLLLIGTEPNTRWRTFTELVVDVARKYDVRLVVTLGALLADVPHSRRVHITGTAADASLVDRLGLQRSRYEGPTGIVGVLHDAFGRAGIDSASLWAAVPHYLAVSPNPKAALALIEKATELIGRGVAIDGLARAVLSYEERATQIVSEDEDVRAYVRLLEERLDERERDEESDEELPSGEALAQELERFLRDRTDGAD